MKCVLKYSALLAALFMLLSVCVGAADYSKAEDIPVVHDVSFPAAVSKIIMDEAFISEAERIPLEQIKMVLDKCASEEEALVRVDSETVLKVPVLKSRATVECTSDYIYSTTYRQGVKYEWMHYADGRVVKTVSYEYEERTAEFHKYMYSVVNDDNQSLDKQRVIIEDKEFGLHIGDMLFGMAIAVVLMMLGVIIVRGIKKM